MFTGIVETTAEVLAQEPRGDVVILTLRRPQDFNDLKTGDSIATNGVCLTLESYTPDTLNFALGRETLDITKWDSTLKPGTYVNLERSLRFGDRVHGHLVSGHIESVGEVVEIVEVEEGRGFKIRLPQSLLPYVWSKGSVALNGVSLTINDVIENEIGVWLIPETLKRTNLGAIKLGESILVETDYLARSLLRAKEFSRELNT